MKKEYTRIVESFEEFIGNKSEPIKIYELPTMEGGTRRFSFKPKEFRESHRADVILRPGGQFEIWDGSKIGFGADWRPTDMDFLIVTE
jgi:hypothetical protein